MSMMSGAIMMNNPNPMMMGDSMMMGNGMMMGSGDVDKCLQPMTNYTIAQRILAAGFISIMTFAGLTLNGLLLTIYYLSWSDIGNVVIYRMMLSLTLSGLVTIMVNIYTTLPCSFSFCSFYGVDALMITLSSPDTFGYYTTLFTNCIVAIERISLFTSKAVNHFIRKFHLLIISIPWLLGFAITVGTTSIGCYKR